MTPAATRGVAATGLVLAGGGLAAVYGCALSGCRQPLLWGPAEAVLWAAVGLVYLFVGLYVSGRPEGAQLGLYMIAMGFAWFLLPDDDFLRTSLAREWDVTLTYFFTVRDLYIPVLVALAFAFPRGRLSPGSRLAVGLLALFYVVRNLSIVLVWDPSLSGWGNVDNLLLVRSQPALLESIESFAYELDDPALLVLLGVVFWRWWKMSEPGRRARRPVVLAAVPWTAAFTLGVVDLWVAETTTALDTAQLVLARLGILVLPIAFLAGIVGRRASHARLGGLLRQLSVPLPPAEFQWRLAEVLGDPDLQLVFWRPDSKVYVDAGGRTVTLPSSPSRIVHTVDRGGEPLAAVIYDAALSDHHELVAAAGTAAALALENARLHATVRAQLEDVRASRTRIVEAADTERRRVERDLHDGAQQRLVTLALALEMAQNRLDGADPELAALLRDAREELDAGMEELRELARGIHPAILTDEGLGAAVEAIADRYPIPLHVDLPVRRYHQSVEAAAYFVISESLTNAARHANARRVQVRVGERPSRLVVSISDDGVGGASLGAGSGLQGLADRVAAVGGILRVHSPLGEGTEVVAEIPL